MQIRFLHSDQGHSTITSTLAFSIVNPAAYVPSPIPTYLKKKIQNFLNFFFQHLLQHWRLSVYHRPSLSPTKSNLRSAL